LDAVHQAAQSWMRAEGGDAALRACHDRGNPLKSRIFTVEPEPGLAFSFWAWTIPSASQCRRRRSVCRRMKFAIVVARWNAVITERLLEGALDALLRSGAKRAEIEVMRFRRVGNSAAARTVANLGKVDAIVTLAACCAAKRPLRGHLQRSCARHRQSQQETGFRTALACSPARR